MWEKNIYNSISLTVIYFLLQSTCHVKALDNGLALTPPMGWMSWQRYRKLSIYYLLALYFFARRILFAYKLTAMNNCFVLFHATYHHHSTIINDIQLLI